jgi:hypothetical protein
VIADLVNLAYELGPMEKFGIGMLVGIGILVGACILANRGVW